MRLSMTLPEGWANVSSRCEDLGQLGQLGPGESLSVIGPTAETRASLVYGPLLPVPLPGDGENFIARALADGVAAQQRLVIKRRGPNQTITGYPMLLVHSVIEDADSAIVEARLTAFYNFLSVNAVAVFRLRNSDGETSPLSDLYTRYEEPVKMLLRSATPDWEPGLTSISALYDGLPNLWDRK